MTRRRVVGSGAMPLVVLWLIAIAFLPCGLGAQEVNATITGTVVDAQGAVMPGVRVAAQNLGTNASTEVVSDGHGGFRLSNLPPGRYRLSAALTGYKSYVRDGIVLRTAETATVAVALEVGAFEETVTVNGPLTAVESNQSTLAQTMENRRIAELPLNGRQVYMLLQMTAGTLFNQQQFGARGYSGTRAWDVNGNITIHGSRTNGNEFLIDGAATAGTGGWSYAPPVDAVEEFKVQSASTDATYGRTSGGVVNMRIKSGTNDWHGTLTGFYRGTVLDANSIQNINNEISKSGHKYFDGEATLGGPVIRDKTFVSIAGQAFHENIPFPGFATLPTDLQRQGDFSQTYGANGLPIIIYDPLTTRPDPARPGRYIRDPFPGNKIPANRINPVAAQLVKDMPAANATGGVDGSNNYIYSPGLGFYRYKSYLVRLDQVFSPRHRLSLSHYANWGNERRSENSLPPGPALRSDNWPTTRKSFLVAVDDSFTINASTMLNARISWNRFDEPHDKEYGPGPALPISGQYQATPEPWYPYISMSGYTDMFARGFRETRNDIWSATASLSKVAGRHFLKAGGDLRTYQLYRSDFGDWNARFDFSRGYTQKDPEQSDATSGQAFASFLLGYPTTSSGVDLNGDNYRNYGYVGAFVQDEWKWSSRGTVTLGLRWDYQSPVKEKNNEMTTGFDTTLVSPLQVPGYQTLYGGLLFAGKNGPEQPYKGYWGAFQPRASAAYKLTEKLALRGSYGRSYLPLTGCCQFFNNPGFSQRTSLAPSIQLGVPYRTLSDPFPEGFLNPDGGASGARYGIGTGPSFVNPDFKPPYSDMWSVGVAIDLPWQIGLDVAYVGNQVTGLPTSRNINAIPKAERDKGIAALGGATSYLSAQVPNPFAGLLPGTGINGPTVPRSQLLRPFPQYTGISEQGLNDGWSKYHAAEVVLSKRMTHGLMATVNYTLSRLEEVTSYLNDPYDWELNGGLYGDLSNLDHPHHIAITFLYSLPFKGNQLVEGWQVNSLFEYFSGGPTSFPGGGYLADGASAKLPKGEQAIGKWFDNSTKTNPRPDGTYAWTNYQTNEYRKPPFRFPDVRDPAQKNMSISVFKNTRVGKGTLQLRGEVFNPLNWRIYGPPNTDVNSSRFGTVTPEQYNFPRQGQVGIRYIF